MLSSLLETGRTLNEASYLLMDTLVTVGAYGEAEMMIYTKGVMGT